MKSTLFDMCEHSLEVSVPRDLLFDFYTWADQYKLQVKNQGDSSQSGVYSFAVAHDDRSVIMLAKLAWHGSD